MHYLIMVFGKNLELSFEFFPPRNEREYKTYENTVQQLAQYGPKFVSYTDGAGFSKNREIIESVEILRQYMSPEVVAHITSCDKTKSDVDVILNKYIENKIESFLIIRGDCPRDEFLMDLEDFDENNSDFEHASDLIEYMFKKGYKNLGFGCFPTGHPEDNNLDETMNTFNLKVKSGGNFSATQLFFDFDDYKKFHENANEKNINVPIYAGIMPLVSFEQAKRFAKVCDISLPENLSDGFASCNTIEEEREFGIKFIADLCDELIKYGADGLHFYTLNRYKAFSDIYKLIKNKDSLNKGEVRI